MNLVDQGNPAAQVASILGIGGSCLRQWMDPEAPHGGAGQCCDAQLVERQRGEQLLKLDLEILSGATAYFGGYRPTSLGRTYCQIWFRLVQELAVDGGAMVIHWVYYESRGTYRPLRVMQSGGSRSGPHASPSP
jgi:hypothetical protein